MAATVIVKLSLGKEIRRFSASTDSLSWSMLSKRITDLFELSPTKLKCTYVDEEGDNVTLSSDAELTEAANLALKSSPAVLRLAVVVKPATPDVAMSDAASETDPGAHGDGRTVVAPPRPENLAPFLQHLATSLPALLATLPPAVRDLIPHAELDVAATIAANAAANASCAAAAPTASAAAGAAAPNAHPGVTCDKTGQCPILGNRYHLVGHNYDLCEAEYDKLTDKEKALYQRIPPPAAQYTHQIPPEGTAEGKSAEGVHPGVECDRSGVCPIVGTRYNLRGHNYDLCQAEFNKLSSTEKLLYDAIPPAPLPAAAPAAAAAAAAAAGPWGGRFGWGRRHGHGHPHEKKHGGMGGGGGCGGWDKKFAARFVRDVSIFDGTQMAPSTAFTKIWRLKNVGELPWPPGTQMLFVGGDQMSSSLTVPISRTDPVMPGEEVDVAVEMVAPVELGRYLGYWRLVGPRGRKFGQRVWCHVQVVDPTHEAVMPPSEADLSQIEQKKEALIKALIASEADTDPSDDTAADDPSAAVAAAPLATSFANVPPGTVIDAFGITWLPEQPPALGPVNSRSVHLALASGGWRSPVLKVEVVNEQKAVIALGLGAPKGNLRITPHGSVDGDGKNGPWTRFLVEPVASLGSRPRGFRLKNVGHLRNREIAMYLEAAEEAGFSAATAKTDNGIFSFVPVAAAPAAAEASSWYLAPHAALKGSVVAPPAAVAPVTSAAADADVDMSAPDVSAASDDGVLVTEGMATEGGSSLAVPAVIVAEPTPATEPAAAKNGKATAESPIDTSTPAGVREALGAMGFTEAPLLDIVLAKHGADLDACTRDLVAASEWDSLLDDLAEMGFENRDLNKTLMLKHNGNMKRTVKELVADDA